MKKTKLLTRLGAVVFALAILFAMAVPVFADTTIPNGNDTGVAANESNGTFSAVDPVVTLTKQIVFKTPTALRYVILTLLSAILSHLRLLLRLQ